MANFSKIMGIVLIVVFLVFQVPQAWAFGESIKEETIKVDGIPDGRITAVCKSQVDAFNISLKGSDGVRFGDTFKVMRGGRIIAEAFVVSNDPENCVISIKGAPSVSVQVGDSISFMRHKKELPKTIASTRVYLGQFKEVDGMTAMVVCVTCGLKMEKAFVEKFNSTDHYAVCKGKSHEFHLRSTARAPRGASTPGKPETPGAEKRTGTGNIQTSRDAQAIFKAPENWTEKVSTTSYDEWGKKISNPSLPSINNYSTINNVHTINSSSSSLYLPSTRDFPVVSGYGNDDKGREIKMQIINGRGCITVYSSEK